MQMVEMTFVSIFRISKMCIIDVNVYDMEVLGACNASVSINVACRQPRSKTFHSTLCQ